MVDYVRLSKTVDKLIKKNGRVINLLKIDQTPADVDKPWNGPADSPSPYTKLELSGVFVPPTSVREFGLPALGDGTDFNDLVLSSQQVVIVYPGENNLKDYISLEDTDGKVWGITGIQILKPGNTTMLGFIGVKR